MKLLNLLKFGSWLAPNPPVRKNLGGLNFLFSNRHYSPYGAELAVYVKFGYLCNPHVFTIVSYLSRNLSQIPWEVFEIKNAPEAKKSFAKYLELKDAKPWEAQLYKNESLEKVEGTALNKLLKRPNELQSWPDFMYDITGWKKLTGNCFIQGIVPVGFPPDYFGEIASVPSPVMQVISDGSGGIAGYKTKQGYSRPADFNADEMLFVKEWNPGEFEKAENDPDYMLGTSMFEPNSKVVQRSNESFEASIGMIKNGKPEGILSSKTQLGPGSNPILIEDRMREQWNEKFQGAANWSRNKVLFSGRELGWQAISYDPKQLGLNETDERDFLTLTRSAGIPIDLFSTGDSTYTNKNEARRDVWQTNLIPELKIWRDNFNRWLVPGYSKKENKNYFIDYDVSQISVLQPDLNQLSERLLREMDLGLWTGNEVRVMLNRDVGSAAHLDQYLMSNKRQFINLEAPTNANISDSG